MVAYWLGTGEVPGSNPGKGENFSMKKYKHDEYPQVRKTGVDNNNILIAVHESCPQRSNM